MTGEMIKPADAEKGEEYWKDKTGIFGYRILGDDAYLIRPNYPHIFNLADMLKKEGVNCDVKPFDVYQGPYLNCSGKKTNFKVWYDSDSPSPDLGDFLVEFYKKGERKFIKIRGFDVSDIEGRIRRKR
jgi:hypothetical protein